jgi:hypothetical protein
LEPFAQSALFPLLDAICPALRFLPPSFRPFLPHPSLALTAPQTARSGPTRDMSGYSKLPTSSGDVDLDPDSPTTAVNEDFALRDLSEKLHQHSSYDSSVRPFSSRRGCSTSRLKRRLLTFPVSHPERDSVRTDATTYQSTTTPHLLPRPARRLPSHPLSNLPLFILFLFPISRNPSIPIANLRRSSQALCAGWEEPVHGLQRGGVVSGVEDGHGA